MYGSPYEPRITYMKFQVQGHKRITAYRDFGVRRDLRARSGSSCIICSFGSKQWR